VKVAFTVENKMAAHRVENCPVREHTQSNVAGIQVVLHRIFSSDPILGSRIRIRIRDRIRVKSWIRIRMKVKIQELKRLKMEPWRAAEHNGVVEALNGPVEGL
jgi:hypothetical protein